VPARRLPGLIGLAPSDVVVVFNPETPDRTAAIEGRGPSPLPWLRESAELLARLGATSVTYPCNTAHYFLRARGGDWPAAPPLVDLIDETVAAVVAAGSREVGLLATTGTIKTRLYQDAFEARGIRVMVPAPTASAARSPGPASVGPGGRVPADVYERFGASGDRRLDAPAFRALAAWLVDALGEQEGLVMEAILGVLGVKAGYTDGVAAQLAEEAAARLVARGADTLVLGCTELPLVLRGRTLEVAGRSVRLVDPTAVVAARLRALGGCPGVAGGLGPEATIDLLEKYGAPDDFTALQRDIFRATIELLGARRDQDHLKLLAVAGPDPVGAAQRLARAGADFLVLAARAAPRAAEVEAATGRPVVAAAPGARVGPEVVRRAVESGTAAAAAGGGG
jgi:aspartate/glutamate racemase